jgi:hypothetical protein
MNDQQLCFLRYHLENSRFNKPLQNWVTYINIKSCVLYYIQSNGRKIETFFENSIRNNKIAVIGHYSKKHFITEKLSI